VQFRRETQDPSHYVAQALFIIILEDQDSFLLLTLRLKPPLLFIIINLAAWASIIIIDLRLEPHSLLFWRIKCIKPPSLLLSLRLTIIIVRLEPHYYCSEDGCSIGNAYCCVGVGNS
jgi:hypothetical protein